MKARDRFLKYVKIHTKSSEESSLTPSTDIQFELARLLVKELTELGLSDVAVDEKCYVYGKIPASEGLEKLPTLGFIAHMDTSPDFCGQGVNPVITENYDGGELPLGNSGKVLSPKEFPHLSSLRGRTLITSDGTTLLGADDKAGIAEIVTLCERLMCSDEPHCAVSVAFTPDEEIGRGADFFDISRFGADFAYTIDGDVEGCLEYENFNAAAASFTVNGKNVHPGSAKNIMINAALVAMEINSMLPSAQIPSMTEGYEGFFHLTDIEGCVEKAKLSYIVRDHSAEEFEAKLNTLKHIEKTICEKYGEGTAVLEVREQYRNMKEKIEPHIHLVDNAILAAKQCGVSPEVHPIRGGTDGARLSYMGLPCPNLGTGGFAFHGPYEHITAEGMEKQTDILFELVRLYSKEA